VLDVDPAPSPKMGGALQFSAHVYCGQTAAWIKMPLGTEVGLGRRDSVRWGPSSPSPKGAQPPQFSANVRCGQTPGWTKMPLGMQVGLGPGDIVFDGDPAIPGKKRHTHPHPIFGPCLLWPIGWMSENASWYGSRPRPRPHHIRPAVRERGIAAPPPMFGPCLLWPRSPISATAELSSCYYDFFSECRFCPC